MRKPSTQRRGVAYATYSFLSYLVVSLPYHLVTDIQINTTPELIASVHGWTENSMGSIGLFLFLWIVHMQKSKGYPPYRLKHFLNEVSRGELYEGYEYDWDSSQPNRKMTSDDT